MSTMKKEAMRGHKFSVGQWVKIHPNSDYKFEVAEIRKFPHGFIMIGIYDEPPSRHVDFWNANSLYVVE